MPGFDHTGPDGEGPRTGWQRGTCRGATPPPRGGRGWGRGFGGRRRRGRGRGVGADIVGTEELAPEATRALIADLEAEIRVLKARFPESPIQGDTQP